MNKWVWPDRKQELWRQSQILRFQEDLWVDQPVDAQSMAASLQAWPHESLSDHLPLGFFKRRLVLASGEKRQLQIRLSDLSQWAIGLVEIVLAEDAELSLEVIVDAKQRRALTYWRIEQAARSSLHWSMMQVQATFDRHDVSVCQRGEQARCQLWGVYAAGPTDCFEQHWRVDHQADQGHSCQTLRGVSAGLLPQMAMSQVAAAKGVRAIDSQQKLDHQLLKQGAVVNTRADLDILTQEISAAHGVTVGAMDHEALFYLMTRGIGLQAAKRLLLIAFLSSAWPCALPAVLQDVLLVEGG